MARPKRRRNSRLKKAKKTTKKPPDRAAFAVFSTISYFSKPCRFGAAYQAVSCAPRVYEASFSVYTVEPSE